VDKRITLAHGNGGRRMHELVEYFRGKFSNNMLNELADAAEISVKKGKIAFSTDSYVVKPLFFPGGDIGKLAVCGTVNDVSMKGARPLYLSLAFIIEEGFEFSLLEKIAQSIRNTALACSVKIVTGDIKVVEKGAADKIYINTAGIGVIEKNISVGTRARIGDYIIINGGIAEHGMAILNAREKLSFKSGIKSDCAHLNFIVQKCMKASRSISVMRDLTRGGLATALSEIAQASNLGIEICESDIPIKPRVKNFCNVLGFDPLYVANEGKFICFVAKKDIPRLKRAMSIESAVIGNVTKRHKRKVYLKTRVGSSRILPVLEEDQLPRIC